MALCICKRSLDTQFLNGLSYVKIINFLCLCNTHGQLTVLLVPYSALYFSNAFISYTVLDPVPGAVLLYNGCDLSHMGILNKITNNVLTFN